MLLPIKIIILASLVKILLLTDKVAMCAAAYAGLAAFFTLILGRPILLVAITLVVGFALSYVYFLLLSRTRETTTFWVIAVVGVIVGFV